jgi:hypothetical protein
MSLPTVGSVVSQAMGCLTLNRRSKFKKMKVTLPTDDANEKDELRREKLSETRSFLWMSLINEWKRLHTFSEKSLRPKDQLLADEHYSHSLRVLMKMEKETEGGEGKQCPLHSFQKNYQFKYERLLLVSTILQEMTVVEQEIRKFVDFQRSLCLSASPWEASKRRIRSILCVEFNQNQNVEINLIQLRNLSKINSQVYWLQRNQTFVKLIDEVLSSPLEEVEHIETSTSAALKERIESLKHRIPEESFPRDSDLHGFFRLITNLEEEIQELKEESTKIRNERMVILVCVILFIIVLSVGVIFYYLFSLVQAPHQDLLNSKILR